MTATHGRRKHTVPRVAYRYVSGRPLDGVRRTDCGYLRPGRKILHETGHASRWAMLPGWRRQVYRLGVPGALAASAAGYAIAPTPALTALGTIGATSAVVGTRRGVRAVRRRHHVREYVGPLASVLAPALGQDAT